jgi:hypothetical protein
MPGSPSNVPRRTAIVVSGSSGSQLKSWPPQDLQKLFEKPPGGVHVPMVSAPLVQVRLPGTTRAWAEAAAPVRRWQRVQWQ